MYNNYKVIINICSLAYDNTFIKNVLKKHYSTLLLSLFSSVPYFSFPLSQSLIMCTCCRPSWKDVRAQAHKRPVWRHSPAAAGHSFSSGCSADLNHVSPFLALHPLTLNPPPPSLHYCPAQEPGVPGSCHPTHSSPLNKEKQIVMSYHFSWYLFDVLCWVIMFKSEAGSL